jgi:S-formylglutathione hydrolase FrmB
VKVRGSLRRRRRQALSSAVALTLLMAALQGFSGSSSAATTPIGVPGVTSDDGSTVVAETVVDSRMVDIAIKSRAMGRTIMARLILPKDWYTQPTRTWPTLWMLEGSGDPADYQGWTQHTSLEQFMSDKDVLVVIPSDGSAGLYTDWKDFSTTGLPQNWETFHTGELPQLLTRGYRSSGVNAAAGDSTGGLGAFAYAARHPGLFRAAASFSGLLDTADAGAQSGIYLMELRDNDNPFGPFGNPWHEPATWAAHNPTALVNQLRGIPLYISSGDGLPGPLGWSSGGAVLEASAFVQSKLFLRAATAAGDNVTVDFYGAGVHDWPYWNRELPLAWPTLAKGLGISAA